MTTICAMNRDRQGRPSGRGMTMLEVLIVIGILSLLVALTIPAVFAARAAARRMSCASNLKNLAVALNAYHTTFECYPSGLIQGEFVGGYGYQSFASPFVRLLPFMEQSELFDQLNIDAHRGYGDGREEVAKTIFICPADQGTDKGETNYRVSYGASPYSSTRGFASKDFPESGQGAFATHRWRRQREFQDGLGRTAGISEKVRGDGEQHPHFRVGDFYLSGILGPPFPNANVLAEKCGQLDGQRLLSIGGRHWYRAGFRYTWYNHVATPNDARTPDCEVQVKGAPEAGKGGVFSATSLHGGSVNVALMDGAVQSIGDSIDLSVWRALGTIAGGESSAQ